MHPIWTETQARLAHEDRLREAAEHRQLVTLGARPRQRRLAGLRTRRMSTAPACQPAVQSTTC